MVRRPDRWQRLRSLFDEAVERPRGERPRYLEAACGGDSELRAEVEELLRAHDEDESSFLEEPVGRVASEEGNENMEGRLIGHYRVLRRLGHGGMGDVYLAHRNDDQDRREEALALDRQALEIRRELLGPRHTEVAQSLNNLGVSLYFDGDLEGAEQLYREALDIRREQLGSTHPYVANTLNNLAKVEQEQGDFPEAQNLYEEALRIWRLRLGEDHPQVSYGFFNLGTLAEKQKDLPRALQLLAQGNDLDRRVLPTDHPYIADSALARGRLLVSLSRAVEAEPHLRDAAAIYKQRYGPEDSETADAWALLGECLMILGNYGEADRILQAAYEGVKAGPAQAELRNEILAKLVLLYTQKGEPHSAQRYQSLIEP